MDRIERGLAILYKKFAMSLSQARTYSKLQPRPWQAQQTLDPQPGGEAAQVFLLPLPEYFAAR